jgi:hypothetical protein
MIENMGFGDLDFLTKEYYLLASAMKTVAQRKEWAKGIKTEKDKNGDIHEKIKTISCVDRDKKMEVFLVVGLESGNSIIYQLADGQPIQAISREEIAKKFDEGMRTLTNDEEKKSKYMELLTGEEYSKNKESRQGKLFSKNGIFKQILGGNTTISKLNDITRDTKKITEQIRTSEITNEEVGEEK